MRIPLFVALGVAILGIIIGSIANLDLKISTAIASPTNGLGLFLSALGPTVSFATVAAMGGGFIAFALKGKYPTALKVVFYVLAAACFGVSIMYPGREWFGINGFYGAAPEWIGYLIVLIPESAALAGGYFLFKDCKNPNMWIVFVIIIGVLCTVLIGAISGLKDIVHRPRYRLISVTDVPFHQWWQPCKNYRELIDANGYASDNFKSYPSGHTAETSILLVTFTFLPLADSKFEKIQLPLFIGGGAMVMLVAFARILAAAHFLTDVSTGATLMLIFLLAANEVVIRIKALHIEEQAEAPAAEEEKE